jgi:hypothetical protein
MAEKVEGYGDITVTIPGIYRDSIAGHLADANHEIDETDVARFRLVADLLDKSKSDNPIQISASALPNVRIVPCTCKLCSYS